MAKERLRRKLKKQEDKKPKAVQKNFQIKKIEKLSTKKKKNKIANKLLKSNLQ